MMFKKTLKYIFSPTSALNMLFVIWLWSSIEMLLHSLTQVVKFDLEECDFSNKLVLCSRLNVIFRHVRYYVRCSIYTINDSRCNCIFNQTCDCYYLIVSYEVNNCGFNTINCSGDFHFTQTICKPNHWIQILCNHVGHIIRNIRVSLRSRQTSIVKYVVR